jgi:hypothetical protein
LVLRALNQKCRLVLRALRVLNQKLLYRGRTLLMLLLKELFCGVQGFFIFQAWIPLYLNSLGLANLGTVGALSALPWAASATVSVCAGTLAERLAARGWPLVRIRRALQMAATLGQFINPWPCLWIYIYLWLCYVMGLGLIQLVIIRSSRNTPSLRTGNV